MLRVPAGDGNFSIYHRDQTGSEAHPGSYLVDTRGSFPGVKRPERDAGHSPPSSAEIKECVELYLHSQYAFMAWCSVKAQGQLYLYLVYNTPVNDVATLQQRVRDGCQSENTTGSFHRVRSRVNTRSLLSGS
jgi:hypothetical protein